MLFKRVKQFWESLIIHPGFLKYFKNTSWLLIERIFRLTVGFFVGVWVIRYLGPEEFGLFSYTQSFVLLFAMIATLGIDDILVKKLVENPKASDIYVGTSFYLKLLGTLVMIILLGIVIFVGNNDRYTNYLILILAAAIIFKSTNVIDLYFQSKVLSKFTVFANLIVISISSILKILFILLKMPLIAFVYLVLFDAFFLAVGLIYFYHKNGLSILDWKFNLKHAKYLLKESWPIILSGILLTAQARIDQIMIKELLSIKELGYYGSAFRLIEVLGFFPIILKSSFYPAIESVKFIDHKIYRHRLLNFYRLNFLTFILIAFPIVFFSELIIKLIFGVSFLPAAIILKIMAFRLFFAYMGTARAVYIVSENLFKYSLVTISIGTVFNIILNYYWITIYGVVGAIYSTIVSFGITIFIIDIFYKKTRENSILMIKGIYTFFKIKI